MTIRLRSADRSGWDLRIFTRLFKHTDLHAALQIFTLWFLQIFILWLSTLQTCGSSPQFCGSSPQAEICRSSCESSDLHSVALHASDLQLFTSDLRLFTLRLFTSGSDLWLYLRFAALHSATLHLRLRSAALHFSSTIFCGLLRTSALVLHLSILWLPRRAFPRWIPASRK